VKIPVQLCTCCDLADVFNVVFPTVPTGYGLWATSAATQPVRMLT